MLLNINKNKLSQTKKSNISFKGPLSGLITQSLINIDTNPMINAALVDVFAMVIPRTYVDTKKRNKYAGGETLFRELTGTIIVCLSSGYIAKGIAHLYNKLIEPKTKINPNSWVTKNTFNLLTHAWDKNKNNPKNKVEKYISDIVSNISGTDGDKISKWKNINWNNVEWLDNPNWKKLSWKDSKFNNIQNDLKNEQSIVNLLSQIIKDKFIDRKDAKQILSIIDYRITNALNVSNNISIKLDDKILDTSVKNIIRDVYDLGTNIFTNKLINPEAALNKLQKMNKIKTLGALSIAATLGLTNQYINRVITKQRTGTDAFVGAVNYENIAKKQTDIKTKNTKNNSKFLALRLLASAGIIALAIGVMKIKSPRDFIDKLEFTGPVTSGNAIRTVYAATLVGRFMASKNKVELRESVTRDYLGFLNWLVLGGFASKGVAQLLDKKQITLFNINKQGKGLSHWLNDITLKSHAEIASKGAKLAKKNIWKLNIAHISGLVYSTVALGFLIPLLNIAITKNNYKNETIAQV